MNTKTVLTIFALVSGLLPTELPANADAMSGIDMGGTKVSQKSKPASLSLTATVNPATPRTGDNTLDVAVRDADGQPVTGLKLTAAVAMTSMDMGTTHPAFTEAGGGHYKATVTFSMDGSWRVVVQSGGRRLAALNFQPGSKAPWKSPQIRAMGTPSAPPIPAAKSPAANAMAGMDMSGSKANAQTANQPDSMASMKIDASGGPDKAAQTGVVPDTSAMSGMDIGGVAMSGMNSISDMRTATVPQLQEKGTYTATGDEDWKAQTGFGHNAGMVGMMNQMMVGGSGMEGMKMPPMTMKFDAQNYAKPEGSDAAGGGGMAGMGMAAPPTTGGNPPAAPSPVQITAAPASAPKAGDNPITITVTDAQGKPITGAKITTSVAMTSMDMGTTHPAVKEMGGGRYAATANFSMAGLWRMKVSVTPPGQKSLTRAFDFTAK